MGPYDRKRMKTTYGRQAKEEMDKKAGPTVNLLRFRGVT